MRVATRASDLALWQANHVAGLLQSADEGLQVEIVPVSTEGDRRADVPLWMIGGKGVFAKEVQRAVLAGDADLAVHSAKDLPALTPPGLVLAAVPARGDVRDALVGTGITGLREAIGAGRRPVVATGSARRRVQMSRLVPGVRFEELRGNMATRLDSVDRFDAIVVAAVALERLGLAERITEVLEVEAMVPQVGQGALAVECRVEDRVTIRRLSAIEDRASRLAVDAERAFLTELGGDCSLPAGAHCTVRGEGSLRLVGVLSPSVAACGRDGAGGGVGNEVGTEGSDHDTDVVVAREDATGDDPLELGRRVGASLLETIREG